MASTKELPHLELGLEDDLQRTKAASPHEQRPEKQPIEAAIVVGHKDSVLPRLAGATEWGRQQSHTQIDDGAFNRLLSRCSRRPFALNYTLAVKHELHPEHRLDKEARQLKPHLGHDLFQMRALH